MMTVGFNDFVSGIFFKKKSLIYEEILILLWFDGKSKIIELVPISFT